MRITINVEELQRQNNELYENINLENQSIFTDMICYIRGVVNSEYKQELVRRDIIEMVLSAQERGENFNNLIGGNFKKFCDNVIASLPPTTKKEKMLVSLNVFCIGLSIFVTLSIIFSKDTYALLQGLFEKETVNYNIPITLGTLVTIAILLIFSVMIVEAITKKPLKKQKSISVIAKIMAIFILTAKFGKEVIFTVNIFVVIGVVVVLFIIHKLIKV